MPAWSSFYSVAAAASASLLGLLFVAVSVAAPTTLGEPRSPVRTMAEQSFQNYLLVLTISCFLLFPPTDRITSGGVVLLAAGSRGILAIFRLHAILVCNHSWHTLLNALRRQIISLAGIGCLLYAAISMIRGPSSEDYLLAAGTLVLLTSSAIASWALLLQLVHDRGDRA